MAHMDLGVNLALQNSKVPSKTSSIDNTRSERDVKTASIIREQNRWEK